MKRFLDYDPYAGATEIFEYDHANDRAIIHRSADVQPVIDRNKILANHTDGWTSREKNMRHAARIPIDVALIWLRRYGVQCWRKDHWPAVRRLLNDSEWRYLRVQNFIL